MPAPVAGIHVFLPGDQTWMAGTSPAMTIAGIRLATREPRPSNYAFSEFRLTRRANQGHDVIVASSGRGLPPHIAQLPWSLPNATHSHDVEHAVRELSCAKESHHGIRRMLVARSQFTRIVVIPGRERQLASPESIATTVRMDPGFAAGAAPRDDSGAGRLDCSAILELNENRSGSGLHKGARQLAEGVRRRVLFAPAISGRCVQVTRRQPGRVRINPAA